MKIGILGSGGYIAEHLKERFVNDGIHEIIMFGRRDSADIQLDLLKLDTFDYSQLDGLDYLIIAAAISGPDMCANQYDYCWKINVDATETLAEKAMKKDCRVLFFSSDAVYGDDKGVAFDEDSTLDGSTPYGRMKREVEAHFMDNSLFKAIRLSYVVSPNDKFTSYCLKCKDESEVADIFHPFYRSCVTLSDVLDTVMWLINNWDEFDPKAINVTGTELVSRVRIVDELNRIYHNRIQYLISKPDDQFYKNRPVITQMTSKYLWDYNIVNKDTFSNKIRKEMEE